MREKSRFLTKIKDNIMNNQIAKTTPDINDYFNAMAKLTWPATLDKIAKDKAANQTRTNNQK